MTDVENLPPCDHCGGTGMEMNDYGISEPCIFCDGTGISAQGDDDDMPDPEPPTDEQVSTARDYDGYSAPAYDSEEY